MKIVVVGTGYVGLVSGACLSEVGHNVTCVDIDEGKIERLKQGQIPIFEPGLEAMVVNNAREGRLTFSTVLGDVIDGADAVFIAVGTPSREDGHADLQYVYAVAEEIGKHLKEYTVVVDKSTVPVGTGREVYDIIRKNYDGDFAVASCPEFLREGSAVDDFMKPDRVVIGADDEKAGQVLLEVFKPLKGEKLVTSIESAELIKYASNAFLATKISFINEIAQLCEKAGGNVDEVAYGIGLDSRIGPKFLQAGIGWGGSCFPKDVSALDQIGGVHGYKFRLLTSVIEVNNEMRKHFVEKIGTTLGGDVKGKTIGVLGLAFKGNTDDIRESAAIDIIIQLRDAGAIIRTFDYEATEHARKEVGEDNITYCDDPYSVAEGADAIVLATEWPQFKELDWKKIGESLKEKIVFDGRNLLKPSRMRGEYGFKYFSVGRNGEQDQ